MPLTRVVIVGRPNVGKSTLFNRLSGRRRALIHDLPGMTRDRLEGTVQLDDGRAFSLTDTGGLEYGADPMSDFAAEIRTQAETAIGEADLILFVVDGTAGVTTGDREVTSALRVAGRPVCVLVNKIDDRRAEENLNEFHALGFDLLLGISAEHGHGIQELLDEIEKRVPPESQQAVEEAATRVAIIGRPNVGKSSLLNRLGGVERSVVSDISGTTRDAIDMLIQRGDRTYRIIDTAGIRRKGKTTDEAEKLAVIGARKAIERCQVALVVIDALQAPAAQDATVAGYAEELGKGAILLVNKWDAVETTPTRAREYELELRRKLKFLEYAPVQFISAVSGRNVEKIFATIDSVAANFTARFRTSKLNEVLLRATRDHGPPAVDGHPRRFFYATQVRSEPPTIALFSNRMEPLHFSYRRYLENRFREELGLAGTPVRFVLRSSRKAPA